MAAAIHTRPRRVACAFLRAGACWAACSVRCLQYAACMVPHAWLNWDWFTAFTRPAHMMYITACMLRSNAWNTRPAHLPSKRLMRSTAKSSASNMALTACRIQKMHSIEGTAAASKPDRLFCVVWQQRLAGTVSDIAGQKVEHVIDKPTDNRYYFTHSHTLQKPSHVILNILHLLQTNNLL